MKKFLLLLMLAPIFFFSCNQKLKEGEYYLHVNGGNIWYKVIGNNNKTPIVMLHGGPGYPSYYLTPLFELAKDRTIITYDQLGCGRSDVNIDTSFMNINSHIEDLSKLINSLKLDEFYLYGHSYGTMLAVEYYMKNKSKVKGLILASPCLNSEKWMLDADTLINSMDTTSRKLLSDARKGIITNTIPYKEAVKKYYASFYHLRMNPYLDSSDKRSGKDMYEHMWGKEEFTATGNLKNYNCIPYLNQIAVPTLFTCGNLDAARPSTVQYFQSLVKNSRFVLINNATHSTMNDNPKEDLAAITDFLHDLDKK